MCSAEELAKQPETQRHCSGQDVNREAMLCVGPSLLLAPVFKILVRKRTAIETEPHFHELAKLLDPSTRGGSHLRQRDKLPVTDGKLWQSERRDLGRSGQKRGQVRGGMYNSRF